MIANNANKPGYKTTEFWVTAATSLITILNDSGLLHVHLEANTIYAVVASGVAYVTSRSFTKAAQAYLGAKTQRVDGSKLNQ